MPFAPYANNNYARFFSGSNYFPHRAEVSSAFERDYKSYPDYNETYYYAERESSPLAKYNYSRYGAGGATVRKPQMGISASNHRRTASNVSSNANFGNRGIHYAEDDLSAVYAVNQAKSSMASHQPQLHQSPAPRSASATRMRVYENIPYASPDPAFNYLSSAAGVDYANVDRPSSLSFDNSGGSRLRSSLKKYASAVRSAGAGGAGSLSSGQHMATTPTNPTPPDSLASDDSSYLSAREGSISSQSRVRFSPETLLDQSAMHAHGQSLIASATTPNRRSSRTRHSISGTAMPSTTSS